MPLVAYGRRWRRIALALGVLLVASYVWYARVEAFRHGGTTGGLLYGFLALLLMAFLLSFGMRKRAYRSRFGKLEEWLQAHIWLGVLSLLVIFLHTGFQLRDRLAVTLLLVIALVIATGILGAILYEVIPRELTEVQSNLSADELSAQLNQLSKTMARIASSKSESFQRIYEGLLSESLPGFLAGWSLVFSGRKELRKKKKKKLDDWANLVAGVRKDEHEDLRQLLVVSRQQKELQLRLVYQQRYRNILDAWLYLHLPLSVGMIVLLVAHVWSAFYYGAVRL